MPMTPVPVREKESKDKPSGRPTSVDTAMAETAEASGATVDKIREILFGSQIKNYETRFARLEDALSRETAEIKDTMRRRLDSLESFFKSETESLAARLKTERDEREETLNAISRELKANTAQLSKKILDLDNRGAQDKSAARQELMAESRKLLDEIRQRNESLSSLVENRVQELRNTKTDRSALAALFVELAVRLKDEGENGKRSKPVRSASEG
jgi:DNA anti-recombination protein RmuC